jgi:hypothetical protein
MGPETAGDPKPEAGDQKPRPETPSQVVEIIRMGPAGDCRRLPARVYANEGISQFLFLKGDSPCEVSYADRAGKYMKQLGVTLPRIRPPDPRIPLDISPPRSIRGGITPINYR